MSDTFRFMTVAEGVQAVLDGKKTYLITEICEDTPIGLLRGAHGAMTVTPRAEQEPEPAKKPEPVQLDPELKEKIEKAFTPAAKETDPPKEKPVRSEPEAKPKPDPGKARVDHGKIMALHRAKWSNAKIADEIGCSIQTVINHIKMEEK